MCLTLQFIMYTTIFNGNCSQIGRKVYAFKVLRLGAMGLHVIDGKCAQHFAFR